MWTYSIPASVLCTLDRQRSSSGSTGGNYRVVVDGAGLLDSGDFTLSVTCGTTGLENCATVGDEDGDGFINCADLDCSMAASCLPAEDCDDNVDNDADGATDCGDTNCQSLAHCQP